MRLLGRFLPPGKAKSGPQSGNTCTTNRQLDIDPDSIELGRTLAIESGSKVRDGLAARRKSRMLLLKMHLTGARAGAGWVHAVEVSGGRGVCTGQEPKQAGPGFQGPL